MRSIMNSMKKRFSNPENDSKEDQQKNERAKVDIEIWNTYVTNPHLPFHRKDRVISDKIFQELPSLNSVEASQRESLFIKKLRICTYVFDFSIDSSMNKEKELKRTVLLELVDYITRYKPSFSDGVLGEVIEMIRANIFRPLPPQQSEILGDFDPEEDVPILEPAWTHLQIVYEFLLRVIISSDTDMRIMKHWINNDFIVRLIFMFQTEDERERDYLKTILHRIYRRIQSHRTFIRKTINNLFFRVITEGKFHFGIRELLEIFGSIINGFVLPLKAEHKSFLKKILLPLHIPSHLFMYSRQLAYCIVKFVEKAPELSSPIVLNGLLRYWPKSDARKEVLFLSELEEVLEKADLTSISFYHTQLIKRLSQSILSPHFQVSDKAIFIAGIDPILRILNLDPTLFWPYIYGSLKHNSEHHWNATVAEASLKVVEIFEQKDSFLCTQILNEKAVDFQNSQEMKDQHSEIWKKLSQLSLENKNNT